MKEKKREGGKRDRERERETEREKRRRERKREIERSQNKISYETVSVIYFFPKRS